MPDFSGINYWAVAVVWLVNVVVGSFWYSPAGFGKQWPKLSGVDIMKLPQNEANRAIGAVSVSAVVQAVVLAIILNSLHTAGWLNGLWTGLLLWAGLTAATTVGVTLYSRKSWKFWWLNSSYFLVVMPVNAIILAVWR